MRGGPLRSVGLLCLLLLVTVQPAQARRRRIVPLPVRIVAYVGEKLEGIRPEFTWTVTYKGQRYELYVLKLTVLTGGATPLDIDKAVAPYRVKFMLAGRKSALEHFVATPPRQQVLITGHVRLDPTARYLMLDTVEGPDTRTPSPTSMGSGATPGARPLP
jgi:hypothetical protein